MVSTARVTSRCLAGVMGAAMAVSAGCNRGTETNTPATDSLKPAAVATAPADRKYLLERVDDAAVVQLYADGFDKLPLREKTLIWHLYQAALAGRDIFYDQRYAHNLEMRDVLEEIITHPENVDPQTLTEIQRYTKLFWINTGPYNNLTARKFVLKCTPEAFAAAATAAAEGRREVPAQGRRVARRAAQAPAADVLRPRRSIRSSPTRRPARARTSSPSSANNLYVGVTMKDIAGFNEQYPLNSRLVKQNGKLVEEVYRVGGKYDAQIRKIVGHLEAAVPFATEPMAKALQALVKFYQTGETADRAAYDIAWVEDKDVAGRHDQRLHRGLHGRARDEGLVGGARLLRQPGEDRRDPQARRRRAVVRRPHAVGREVPQAGRHGHHRQRHRRRRRNRRLGADHARRHQPAERSGDSREVRQQVGVALERERGLRPIDVGRVPAGVRVDAGRGGARREVEQRRRRADDQHARGDRPRVGQDLRAAQGQPADRAQGTVFGARGIARRSRRRSTSCRIRSSSSSGSSRRRTTPRSCRPSTRATRATRSSSSGASARARRSKKTTCATGR